jgi:thioredoxin 1
MIFNKDNFKQEVTDNQGLVMVDFSAAWCGPCQMLAPIIDELIKDNQAKAVKIGKLDVDVDQAIAEKYQVMGVPTIILFKGGKIVEQLTGYRSKEDLQAMIDKNL